MANLTASAAPELVLEMDAMEITTPAHCDEWNRRHQQLLDNDNFLKKKIDALVGSEGGGSGGIPGLDPGIGADTLVGAINEVFTLGGERKEGFVAGLTAMGMAASTDDTWDTLLGALPGIVREWEVQSSGTYGFTHDGGYKWTSNNQGVHSSTAETTWTIDIPSEMAYTFLYRVSSESGYDKLTIVLDGDTIVNAISGDKAETGVTRTLSAGEHTIKAAYTKDGSTNSYQDMAYIILNPVVKGAPVNTGAAGTMPDMGGTTVDAASVTRDDNYTYLGIPAAGYYDTKSKVRAANGNLNLIRPGYIFNNGPVSFAGGIRIGFFLSRGNQGNVELNLYPTYLKLYANYAPYVSSITFGASIDFSRFSKIYIEKTIRRSSGSSNAEVYLAIGTTTTTAAGIYDLLRVELGRATGSTLTAINDVVDVSGVNAKAWLSIQIDVQGGDGGECRISSIRLE